MIRSCAALSSAVGLQKSFSTSDISQLPSPEDVPNITSLRGAVSELALNCIQRSGLLLDNARSVFALKYLAETVKILLLIGWITRLDHAQLGWRLVTWPPRRNCHHLMGDTHPRMPHQLVRHHHLLLQQQILYDLLTRRYFRLFQFLVYLDDLF